MNTLVINTCKSRDQYLKHLTFHFNVNFGYRIMQIIRGGKVSRLHDLFVIRGKTFAIVQQFETPYNKNEKIRWKTFAIGG